MTGIRLEHLWNPLSWKHLLNASYVTALKWEKINHLHSLECERNIVWIVIFNTCPPTCGACCTLSPPYIGNSAEFKPAGQIQSRFLIGDCGGRIHHPGITFREQRRYCNRLRKMFNDPNIRLRKLMNISFPHLQGDVPDRAT